MPPPDKRIRLTRNIKKFWDFGNNFYGFTLAEVLVTLGIIGVVSAMTVPSLIQNHQKKTYVTQLHKFYNEIQQVFNRILTDRNAVNLFEAGFNSSQDIYQTFKTYLKIVNDCGETPTPCFANEYRGLDNSIYKPLKGDRCKYTLSLASGVAICFDSASNGNTLEAPIGFLYVDINGAKGPNIVGRDYFLLFYFNDGSLDEVNATPICRQSGICGDYSSPQEARKSHYCEGNWPAGCFGKILNDNWEMTY